MPYLKWEVGPEVPSEQFQYFRRGILDMHLYATSLGLLPLPGYATFYLYHDPESAARTIARLERRRLEDARRKFADDGWAGLAGLEPENEDSGWIMVNLLAYVRYPEPWRHMRVAAHELSHVYQYTLQEYGHFDTTHQEVRVIGPAWIQEGFATFHSDRALAMGGVVPYEQGRQRLIRQSHQVDVQLEETETYDGLKAGPGRSDMAALASELLAAKAGEEALISFWRLLGTDTPWREAFEAAFGMTVEEFYPLFEEHRADGFPELDLPDIAPRAPLATADREALAALYDATGGVYWEKNGNWLSDEPGSNWHGVATDREGYVTVGPAGQPVERGIAAGIGQSEPPRGVEIAGKPVERRDPAGARQSLPSRGSVLGAQSTERAHTAKSWQPRLFEGATYIGQRIERRDPVDTGKSVAAKEFLRGRE